MPAIDISAVIGLATGAFIAGLVGVFTVLLDNRLARRENHRNKLIYNLTLVNNALLSLAREAWPQSASGYENAGLPLPSPFGLERDRLIRIKENEIERLKTTTIPGVPLLAKLKQGNMESTEVSYNLFHDLKHHFRSLYESLTDYEKLMRTTGACLIASYYDLTLAVYDCLEARTSLSDPSKGLVMTLPFTVRQNTPLAAQMIFNLSLSIPEGWWPNRYELCYKGSPDKTLIDEIVDEVTGRIDTKQVMANVDSMKAEYTVLSKKICAAVESDTRLKGRCRMT